MRVLAVVVLYKRSVDRSQTLTSLGNALRRHPELLQFLQVLLWDNSPMPLTPTLEFPFKYVHSSENIGTSGAFNRAMEFAEDGSTPWLLLLDQDTTLSEDFVPKMLAYSRRFTDSLEIAAVVPLLWCRGQVVSPKRFRTLYRISPVPPPMESTKGSLSCAIARRLCGRRRCVKQEVTMRSCFGSTSRTSMSSPPYTAKGNRYLLRATCSCSILFQLWTTTTR